MKTEIEGLGFDTDYKLPRAKNKQKKEEDKPLKHESQLEELIAITGETREEAIEYAVFCYWYKIVMTTIPIRKVHLERIEAVSKKSGVSVRILVEEALKKSGLI